MLVKCKVSHHFGADDAISFNGKNYAPNETRGFIKFEFSYAFPNYLVYKTALHPTVIEKSWESLLYQQLNWMHNIRLYKVEAKEKGHENSTDRILGSILDATYPRTPIGGWKINKDPKQAPFIEGVAAFAKQAMGMNHVVGKHTTGRHEYTVSMEVQHVLDEGGFAVTLPSTGKPIYKFSPPDFIDAGFEYIPFLEAPADLRKCFSKARNRVIAEWQARPTFLLMGGLENPVHYAGLAIVEQGAEGTANIQRMAAGYESLDIVSPFNDLGNLLKKAFTKVNK